MKVDSSNSPTVKKAQVQVIPLYLWPNHRSNNNNALRYPAKSTPPNPRSNNNNVLHYPIKSPSPNPRSNHSKVLSKPPNPNPRSSSNSPLPYPTKSTPPNPLPLLAPHHSPLPLLAPYRNLLRRNSNSTCQRLKESSLRSRGLSLSFNGGESYQPDHNVCTTLGLPLRTSILRTLRHHLALCPSCFRSCFYVIGRAVAATALMFKSKLPVMCIDRFPECFSCRVDL